MSNAYNRPGELGAELRDQILAAASELGYSGPDVAARMLRTGNMGAIGVLFTDDLRFVFTDPDTTSFMQGVAETSALSGTGLTLLPAPPGIDLSDTAVGSAAVDGHIVFSVGDGDPALDAVLARNLPIVVVDEPDLGGRTSFVGIDDHAGAHLAATHLIDLGHRRMAVLLGRLSADVRSGSVSASREKQATMRIARERIAGYRSAMVDGGLDPEDLVLWEAGGNDPDSARIAAVDLIGEHPTLTGLLCFTDQIAIGATQAGRVLGRRIPEDLSVVGFDDVPRAQTWDPPITTIRQPLVDKGRVAAELLLEQIDGARPRRIELPIELVVRASTGVAAPPLTTPVDSTRHPIGDTTYAERCRARLDLEGALVLGGFFGPRVIDQIIEESGHRETEAFYASSTHNVYLTPPNSDRGDDHPFNRQVASSKGLLADDQIPTDSPLRGLYNDPTFRRFLCGVFGINEIHSYADNLSSVNVHFAAEGMELGWHFDNSSFAVTMLLQAPETGGAFEYVADVRDADAGEMAFDRVDAVLNGDHASRTLSFSPGDLVMFRGRDALHRVTPTEGSITRMLVVFAFNDQPDVALDESALMTFYGRTN